MSERRNPTEVWREVVSMVNKTIEDATKTLADEMTVGGELSRLEMTVRQPILYELAFAASELRALDVLVSSAERDLVPPPILHRGAHDLFRSIRFRLDDFSSRTNVDVLMSDQIFHEVALGDLSSTSRAVVDESEILDDIGLAEDFVFVAREFRRFAQDVIAPRAQGIHRDDRDIPDEIIDGLAQMGAFGLSIPQRFGGSQDEEHPDHLAMVVATEELSRASLGAGGSLITRQEILASALLRGGTQNQKQRWLPAVASGDKLVAVGTTEPDHGSDVAGIMTNAVRDGDDYLINGTKTWTTFAGRADLLLLLARTDSMKRRAGLSLFVVEKPRCDGHSFDLSQPTGGRMIGHAIPTIGYRGMHSFEVGLSDWRVPAEALVGEEGGEGRGLELQLGAFAAGRLQTAARALGVMRASVTDALSYARERRVFGEKLIEFPLITDRLASMIARIAALKLFTYEVAHRLSSPLGQFEASMIKALSCRSAEVVTRDAMQMFGGYGYAEEYPVSRYFVDARVLSIFEGTEEILALKVIAPHLVEQAMDV